MPSSHQGHSLGRRWYPGWSTHPVAQERPLPYSYLPLLHESEQGEELVHVTDAMRERELTETYDLWDRLLPGAACAVHFPCNSPKSQDIVAIPPISEGNWGWRKQTATLLSTEVAVWQYEAILSNSDVHVLSTIRQGCKHIVQVQWMPDCKRALKGKLL